MKSVHILLAALFVPSFTSAHLAGGGGLLAGALHPVLGLDHLLAIVAVGILAARHDRIDWRLPLAFVGVMALGGVLGMRGLFLPLREAGIILSVALLGTLIALRTRIPDAWLIGIAGLAGLLHGHAHGTEVPALAHPVLYSIGFVLATAALHTCGAVFARFGIRTDRGTIAVRSTGALMLLAAVAFVLV